MDESDNEYRKGEAMGARDLHEIGLSVVHFIRDPENSAARAMAGSHSIPFRGTYANTTYASVASEELSKEGADLLWFGSNPNLPPKYAAECDPSIEFETLNLGHFTEVIKNSTGQYVPTFDPISKPQRGWVRFRQAITASGIRSDRILYANLFPWASSQLRDAVVRLRSSSEEDLHRAVKFSISLATEIVYLAQPKRIIIPLSFTRNPAISRIISGTWLCPPRSAKHIVTSDSTREVNMFYAEVRFPNAASKVTWLPHPSSIVPRKDQTQSLLDCLKQCLAADT